MGMGACDSMPDLNRLKLAKSFAMLNSDEIVEFDCVNELLTLSIEKCDDVCLILLKLLSISIKLATEQLLFFSWLDCVIELSNLSIEKCDDVCLVLLALLSISIRLASSTIKKVI